VALSFHSFRSAPGDYLVNSFNYYAIGPLRYFGLFLLARLSLWYLEGPSFSRLVPISAIAFLVALNNLDFGIPAAAGVLLCAILFPPPFRFSDVARRLLAMAAFMTSVSASVAVYLVALRIGRGAWPRLGNLFLFQKVFAGYGFSMLPLPDIGFYWVMYLTFMAAVLIPIYEVFIGLPQENGRRTLNGVLAYWGVAGMGPLTYYIGRSHAEVLFSVLCAWAFTLANLVCRAWILWRSHLSERDRTGSWLTAIPQVLLACLVALTVPMLAEFPSPGRQLHRLAVPDMRSEDRDAKYVALIQKYLHPGDSSFIVYRDAHWIALKAGVKNVFPFAHPDSLIILPQVDIALAGLARLPAGRDYVFGAIVLEMRQRLAALGFKRLEAQGDFAVWGRPTS
jgi:hypothetical protein